MKAVLKNTNKQHPRTVGKAEKQNVETKTNSQQETTENLKVQMKCFSFIAEFERAAKIRKTAVYRFLISLPVPEL